MSGNRATYGGGVYLADLIGFALLTLADSTVTGNTADVDGGGIDNTATQPIVVMGTSVLAGNSPNDCVGAGC